MKKYKWSISDGFTSAGLVLFAAFLFTIVVLGTQQKDEKVYIPVDRMQVIVSTYEIARAEKAYENECAANLIKAEQEAIAVAERQAHFDAVKAEADRVRAEEEAQRQADLEYQRYNPSYIAPTYRYGGDMRELRKGIESGGNYSTDTGNGYLGAYQFSEQYMRDRYNSWGLAEIYGEYSRDGFLSNPDAQDAAADAYARDWYGGWENIPTSGGW